MNNNSITFSLEASFQDFITAILKVVSTNKFTHIKTQTGSDSRGEHTRGNPDAGSPCIPHRRLVIWFLDSYPPTPVPSWMPQQYPPP